MIDGGALAAEPHMAQPVQPLEQQALARAEQVTTPCRLITYIPRFLTPAEANTLVRRIFASKKRWITLRNRRLQTWGMQPEQLAESLSPLSAPTSRNGAPEPLPSWLASLGSRIAALGIFNPQNSLAGSVAKTPNHVLINEYRPGQGIYPHKDGPKYHPAVATISLGEHALLDFYQGDLPQSPSSGPPKPRFSVVVEPCSLIVLTEQAYTDYMHGIQESFEFDVSRHDGTDGYCVANASGFLNRYASERGLPTAPDRVTVHREGTRISLTFRVWQDITE
eukprot:jgi/Hompol1/3725/HPOL_003340-RA